jgi:hypothetical protein
MGLPVESTWDRRRHAQIQLRTLLDTVVDTMEQHRLTPSDLDTLLAPATDLLDGTAFWSEPAQGVLFLLAPEGPEHSLVRRLPFAPAPFATVDAHYNIRPIWRHLQPDQMFYILALSAGGVELYRASRYTIETVPLTDVPTTLEEAQQYDEHSRSIGYHTRTQPGAGSDSGKRAAQYFGYEDAGDKAFVKEGILRFFRTLDNGVRDVLSQDATPAPLFLAGTDALRGLYRKVNQYPHLHDTDIDTAPQNGAERAWDEAALHERGWDLLQPQAEADRASALDQFHSTPERTAANVGSVLLAAADGRVDTLFATDEREAWGQYDAAQYRVEVHPHREPEDIELMNAAVLHTLQAGGTVYIDDADALPDGTPIAALLRY